MRRRRVQKVVPHVLQELLLLVWLVWLGYWEWLLLLCNVAFGMVIVHTEELHDDDDNAKSEDNSIVDTTWN